MWMRRNGHASERNSSTGQGGRQPLQERRSQRRTTLAGCKYRRQDSNPRRLVPKTSALSTELRRPIALNHSNVRPSTPDREAIDLTPSLAALGLPPLRCGEGAERRVSAKRG